MRDLFANSRKPFPIASPAEDAKILRSKQCTQEGVRAGAKAAAIACVASTVPTLVAVRKIPWAKRNLNYTAQALIVSAGAFRFKHGKFRGLLEHPQSTRKRVCPRRPPRAEAKMLLQCAGILHAVHCRVRRRRCARMPPAPH